ncbi:alpha-1,2-Mannosidase [Tolypocladium paradoxum]|uniref:alpha-1,2-Mannosidase n=1 Tax=Tolypocladium paradoxum TaxID=94208 RepID=A0A2S4KLS6_9HYPO|nr:alpha-1,2-Mannosidase [Tolypocladium paradoxum]
MPRRRYKLFMVCAVLIVFLLYRATQNSWDQQPGLAGTRRPPPPAPQPAPKVLGDVIPVAAYPPQEPLDGGSKPAVDDKPKSDRVGQGKADDEEHIGVQIPTLKDEAGVKESAGGTDSLPPEATPATKTDSDTAGDKVSKEKGEDEEPLRWKNPPKDSTINTPPMSSTIHWTKPREHFPVPNESIITLPTATAKRIPKIQYDFRPESEQAKAKRIERQNKVKAELERSWAGYRKYAWMHDELSPVSGSYRDPFCGWSATLVDSLDTLWIAGLKDEFDEAAKAVKGIDFTHTHRLDIPVFETTIRYLGGLIAAFDVSGGAEGGYSFLLDKAVELAEILMGIFDTPNRMPILYYRWKPEYASQPHVAGRVGMAELATLSMEFTRLAQLTAQHKYYDAIDRITNALIGMQKEGTLIPGLFPETLDASGCNRTATTIRDSLSMEAQDQLSSQELLTEPEGFGGAPRELNPVLDANRRKERPSVSDDRIERRTDASIESQHDGSAKTSSDTTSKSDKRREGPLTADGKRVEWDCVPQGLVPGGFGFQNFHVGGGQDSAYEYFPKEYLLLGGREPKYQKLYEDTIEAINSWLLFRPMMIGNWDVLFPAKVGTRGDPKNDLEPEYEVAHLTCFIGGMYALGGKLFGRPKDIENAKKLTDGCVWAYQSTASGIMPEAALVVPCPTLDKCAFNETRWWDSLDPSKDWRDEQVRTWEAEQDEQNRAEKEEIGKANIKKQSENNDEAETSEKSTDTGSTADNEISGKKSSGLGKRAAVPAKDVKKASNSRLDEEEGSELPQSLRDKLGKGVGGKDAKSKTPTEGSTSSSPDKPLRDDSTDATDSDAGSPPKVPTLPTQRGGKSTTSDSSFRDKPMSHKEYVLQKLESEGLPPGFVAIPSTQYILRPEAVESVWYMYRITGDPTWMDKGWDMFEATVHATRTAIANSAVSDVLAKEPALKDEMESFWIAETLKYYYLLFSEPNVISLDEWVLNTEAHPFKL